MNIVLGKSGHKNLAVEIDTLLVTRMLIQADSGGGKTWLMRVLAEQFFGKVQVIIIDPEGEFATLREKYGYVLVGKGGETPADTRSAALLAHRLLELKASAVCDIYEMKSQQRHTWVRLFLEAMIDAPKNLWHPCVVIVDEAHIFCMDAETEILTFSGWKTMTQTEVGDLAVCYDMETERCSHQVIQRVIHREYSGEMVSLKSDGIDALVTPDHRVVLQRIQRAKGRYKIYKPQFVEARKIPNHVYIPVADGILGRGIDGLSTPMCRVLGWIITEGYFCGTHAGLYNRYIGIEQSLRTKKNGVEIARSMRAVLVGFFGLREPSERRARGKSGPSLAFYLGRLFSERVLSWLRDLHRIPREILTCGSIEQLTALYNGLLEGDGTCHKGKWRVFYPGHNEGLADDFQELCTRLGISASKKFVPQTGQWTVLISQRERHYIRKPGKQFYSGKTWDITVPSGAFIARRRGKVFVTGNCPEKGKGESEASQSMIDLCTRGRKRGYCAIFATQRLSVLNKDASGMLLNRLIGPTFESGNVERAIKELNVAKDEVEQFRTEIKTLDPGHFYAFGRAVSKERVLFTVGHVQTTHAEVGSKHSLEPPPPPDNIAKLLPKLSDLPKAAEEKAKTEAELRKEVRDLKTQLRTQPTISPDPSVAWRREHERVKSEGAIAQMRVADLEAYSTGLRNYAAQKEKAIEAMKAAGERFDKDFFGVLNRHRAEGLEMPQPPSRKKISAGEIQTKESSHGRLRAQAARSGDDSSARTITHPRPDVPYENNGDLKPPQLKLLRAIAEFESIGVKEPTRQMVASWLGVKAGTGTFKNYLSQLRVKGLLRDGHDDRISLTEDARSHVPEITAAVTTDELLSRSVHIFGPTQGKILRIIHGAHPEFISRDSIAGQLGISAETGTFKNYISQLRVAGMVEDGPDRAVKASDWMFID